VLEFVHADASTWGLVYPKRHNVPAIGTGSLELYRNDFPSARKSAETPHKSEELPAIAGKIGSGSLPSCRRDCGCTALLSAVQLNEIRKIVSQRHLAAVRYSRLSNSQSLAPHEDTMSDEHKFDTESMGFRLLLVGGLVLLVLAGMGICVGLSFFFFPRGS
jgi:hypothetical protein